jgi:O-methyltransferase
MWPSYPPKQYLGQLEPEFQAEMARRRATATVDDCNWYHTFDLPDGGVIDGAWDLRGGEQAYLGGVDVRGKRVIEPGPASGYLSFYMDRQGADVVAFETGFDMSIDLLPVHGGDTADNRLTLMRGTVDGVHNSWWYMHRLYGSSAKLVHGDLYDLPGDLGEFDIAVFGAILLHLREPWGAISEVASRTTERIIVTDLIQDRDAPLDSNIMRFSPLAEHEISNWWSIYPGAVVSMLERVGFGRTTITEHTQTHHLGHRLDDEAVQMSMYTVVGERG